jgi:hypothetical protein
MHTAAGQGFFMRGPFPRHDVFEFSRKLFGELEAAHNAGDHNQLEELWSRATNLP